MCGRFTLHTAPRAIADSFRLAEVPLFEPRFNVAPSTPVAVVRQTEDGSRSLAWLMWGLVPHWARGHEPSAFINARSETAAAKPAFRDAFRSRRCLIVADGFYEWQKTKQGKQPWYFRLRDGRPFAFAGIWDRWHTPDGELLDSCAILTTNANEIVRPVHHRMPVILPREVLDAWSDPGTKDPADLLPLLKPVPADEMEAWPVSEYVNNARNEGERCIEPVAVA